MRLLFTLMLACAWSAQTHSARADILRCGSVLIEAGDDASYVLKKCGEPTSKTTIDEPIWVRDINGNMYQTGATQSELWRYDRGPQNFPAVLIVANGHVQAIEFEKTRG